jgi:hypothetical protein
MPDIIPILDELDRLIAQAERDGHRPETRFAYCDALVDAGRVLIAECREAAKLREGAALAIKALRLSHQHSEPVAGLAAKAIEMLQGAL